MRSQPNRSAAAVKSKTYAEINPGVVGVNLSFSAETAVLFFTQQVRAPFQTFQTMLAHQ